MTKGLEVSTPLVVEVFMDAACFLACSSASFKDKARAALRSGSSSSSADVLFLCGFDSFLAGDLDCGT